MEPRRTLHETMRPLTLLNKFFGNYPYSKDGLSAWIWSTLVVNLILGHNVYKVVTMGNTMNYTVAQFVGAMALNILPSLFIFITSVQNVFHPKKVFVFLKKINALEYEMRASGIQMAYCPNLMYCDVFFRFVVLLIGIFTNYWSFAVMMSKPSQMLTRFISHNFTGFILSSQQMLMAWWAVYFGLTFRGLAQHLHSKSLESLVELHRELCIIVKQADCIYGLHNALIVTNIYILSIADIYVLGFIRISIAVWLFIFTRLALRLYEIWITITAYAFVENQAEKFTQDLFSVVLRDPQNLLISNVKVKSHMAKKERIGFNGLGLFHMDYPLIFSMLASGVTYLVIYIQLGSQ